MRTYGRVGGGVDGVGGTWVVVETDENGYDDEIWLTTLCQTLLLGLGESPTFGNYGIPARQTIVTQIFPDFYVAQTQQQFAPYFASLVIQRVQGSVSPAYKVKVVAHSGAILTRDVAL